MHLFGLVAWGHTTVTWFKLFHLRATVTVTGLDHFTLSLVEFKCRVKLLFISWNFRYFIEGGDTLYGPLPRQVSLIFVENLPSRWFWLRWLSPMCFVVQRRGMTFAAHTGPSVPVRYICAKQNRLWSDLCPHVFIAWGFISHHFMMKGDSFACF